MFAPGVGSFGYFGLVDLVGFGILDSDLVFGLMSCTFCEIWRFGGFFCSRAGFWLCWNCSLDLFLVYLGFGFTGFGCFRVWWFESFDVSMRNLRCLGLV